MKTLPKKPHLICTMFRVTVLRDNKLILGPKRFLEKLAAEKAGDRLRSRFPYPCEVLVTPSISGHGRRRAIDQACNRLL